MIRNKIDLHLHIDGSVRPETVYEIAREEKIEPEMNMTLEEIRQSMVIQPGTFDPDFLTFEPPIRAMQSVGAIKRIVFELIEDLSREGVQYAELRFAPQFHLQRFLSQREVVGAAVEGLRQGLEKYRNISAGLILCCMDTGLAADNHAENIETIELAGEWLHKGVCGVDLAGYESDLLNFADLFVLAKSKGIPTTCHSEFTVAEAVVFHTDRIGHGYQFALTPEYQKLCLSSGVTLEMCPISSVKYDYGLAINENHPLRVLYMLGAKICVNTDNRTVLATTLEQEYECMRRMGFTDEEIEAVNENAIRACFADEETKCRLLGLTK